MEILNSMYFLFSDKKKHHVTKSAKKHSSEYDKGKKGVVEKTLHKKEEHEKSGKKHHSIDTNKHHTSKHKEGGEAHGAMFKHEDKQKKTGSVKVSLIEAALYIGNLDQKKIQ